MKLKKIASLALAGVMAVSMLAGCAGKTNTNTNTDTETSTGDDLASVMALYQTAVNSAKINYTNDAELSADLQKVVDLYNSDAYDTAAAAKYNVPDVVRTAFKAVSGIKGNENVKPDHNYNASTVAWGDQVIGAGAWYDEVWNEEKGDLVGEYTGWNIYAYKGYTKEAAMNAFATKLNNEFETSVKLPTQQSNASTLGAGKKFYVFDYNGSVGMASMKDNDGQNVYFFVYAVTQTVSVKTV